MNQIRKQNQPFKLLHEIQLGIQQRDTPQVMGW